MPPWGKTTEMEAVEEMEESGFSLHGERISCLFLKPEKRKGVRTEAAYVGVV